MAHCSPLEDDLSSGRGGKRGESDCILQRRRHGNFSIVVIVFSFNKEDSLFWRIFSPHLSSFAFANSGQMMIFVVANCKKKSNVFPSSFPSWKSTQEMPLLPSFAQGCAAGELTHARGTHVRQPFLANVYLCLFHVRVCVTLTLEKKTGASFRNSSYFLV